MNAKAESADIEAARALVPDPSRSDDLIERLVQRIGGRAGSEAVFGAPIARGDVTVVPVARVRWGFGAGSGTPPSDVPDSEPTGVGVGGGVMVDPIGYLEIGADGAAFKPIVSPYPSPVFLIACGISAAILLRGVARIVRR